MPAYSKTNWVDGSVPAIDATNLNKIEQGIFDSLRQDGSTTMSGQLVTTAGSVATPAIAPTGDSNTGIFFPAADKLGVTIAGTERVHIAANGHVSLNSTADGVKMLTVGTGGDIGLFYGQAICFLNNTTSTFTADKAIYNYFNGSHDQLQIQPSGTGGGVISFHTGTTAAATRTEAMRINPNGQILINTTNTDSKVVVQSNDAQIMAFGNGNANTAEMVFRTNTLTDPRGSLSVFGSASTINYQGLQPSTMALYSTADIAINAESTKHIRFHTGTEKMRITSAGNVGVGTSNPANIFSVVSATGQTGLNAGTVSSPVKGNLWYDTDGSGWKFQIGKWQSSAFTAQMTFQDNGNVGIGTTSPANLLDISSSGDPIISTYRPVNVAAGIGRLRFDGNNSSSSRVNYSFVQGEIETATAGSHAGNLVFYTANAGSIGEKMRITSAGYLLIGYTSSNGAYPLQVNGQIFATSSTIATSDGKYKKDIVSLDGALDIVKALNPVQFSWKDHPVHKFNTDVPTIGFIAQEVEQALADKSYLTSIIKKSECTWENETGEFVEREVTRDVEKQVTREVEREVTETIDGEEVTRTITEEVTESVIEQVTEIVTEPVKETHTEEFLGIAESNLIAILTKAVQELTAKVEALEAQLAK